jgi:hypothetical protein
MSNLPFLKMPVRDSDGAPLASAALYFYQAGTSTPKDTYSDEARNNANANPVISDSAGYFGEIYLDTAAAYKAVLKDAAGGTTIYTVDNINAAQLASDGLVTRQKQIASNPLDYDAVGDGAADESSEVQDAIDNCTGTIDLLGKTFRCDSAITLSSGNRLINGTLDFTNCTDDEYIKIEGTLGSALTLSGDAAVGDTDVDLSAVTGLAAGDWIFIYADATIDGSTKIGEMCQIDSIATLKVNLCQTLEYAYTTANNASVKKVSGNTGAVLDGLVITANSAASGAGRVVYCEHATEIDMRNIYITGVKATGIELRGCADVAIDNCRVEDDAGAGIGIEVAEHTHDVQISRAYITRMNTGIKTGAAGTSQGLTRYVSIDHCKMNRVKFGVHPDEASQHVHIDNCDIAGVGTSGGYGVLINGADIRVCGNRIHETGDYAIGQATNITATYDDFNLQIISNVIEDCTNGILIAGNCDSVTINDNTINASGARAISTNSASTIAKSCVVCGNTIFGFTTYGIELQATSTEALVNNNAIHYSAAAVTAGIYIAAATDYTNVCNNIMRIRATDGIHVVGTTDVVVSGNNITEATSLTTGIKVGAGSSVVVNANKINSAETGISAAPGGECTISNNSVRAASTDGIYIGTGSDNTVVIGNVINCTADGIHFVGTSGAENLIISNNAVTGVTTNSKFCLFLDGYIAGFVVNGNTFFRDDDLEDNIHLSGDAAGAIDLGVISGNFCKNGVYGIGEPTDANNTNIINAGNLFKSMATGDTEGTVTDDAHASVA